MTGASHKRSDVWMDYAHEELKHLTHNTAKTAAYCHGFRVNYCYTCDRHFRKYGRDA